MDKLKVVLIGLGHLGKIHLKCIKQTDHFQLVGVWDIDKKVEAKINAEENLPAYDTINDLLASCDAVIIVSPTSTHAQLALQAIEHHKHVFIEKPVSATLPEALKIKHAQLGKNLKIQVGHVERFNPAFVAVKDQFTSPLFIEVHRLAEFKPRGTDVSVVMDLMIHDIDLILTIKKSNIVDIRASGVAVMSPTADICNARLEFEDGATANLTASRISLKQMRKIRMFQRDQYFSLDLLKKESQIVKINDAPVEGHPFSWPMDTYFGTRYIQVDAPILEPTNAILDELNAFASSIRNDTVPVVSLDQGIAALKVAAQIQELIDKKSSIL